MKVKNFTEVRTVKGAYVVADSHFFFDGIVYNKGTGKGNFAGTLGDGAMRGIVKVSALTSGRFSFRSIGKAGNGRLVHISRYARVTVDGVTLSVEDFYAQVAKPAGVSLVK